MCVKSKPFRIMSEIAFRYRCLVHTFPVWLDVTYQHFTRAHLKVHKRSFCFVDSVGEQLPRWWKALLVVCENVIIYSRSTDHIRTSIIFFDKLMEENKFFTYILRSGLIAWCSFLWGSTLPTCRLWSWPHRYKETLYFFSKGLSFDIRHLVGPWWPIDQTG